MSGTGYLETTPSAQMPTGGGGEQVFYENAQVVTSSYTIPSTSNAMTAGPITINSGAVITVPSGSTWTIV